MPKRSKTCLRRSQNQVNPTIKREITEETPRFYHSDPFSIGISMGFLSLVQVFSIHRLGKLTPAAILRIADARLSWAQPRVSAVTTWQVDFHDQFIIWYVYIYVSQPTEVKRNMKHTCFLMIYIYIWHIWAADHIFGTSHNFVGCSYHASECRTTFCNLNVVFPSIFGNQATPQFYSFT